MLRKALCDLCADPEMRAELQRAASRRAQEYSAERMGDGYTSLYDQLLSSDAIPTPSRRELSA
jgi:glycosyltransferase involved in cell wall biosynthesis